ncbi:MAG: hypothetical protein WB561_11925, partial [Terracidiphilus sp.]
LHKREAAEAQNRAESKVPVRGSSPSPNSSNSWYQHRDHGSRAGPLPAAGASSVSCLSKLWSFPAQARSWA